MSSPVWLSGIIVGFILVLVSRMMDNTLLAQTADTFLIFGIIITVISIGIVVVPLVKRK